MTSLTNSPAWKALEAHHRACISLHMNDLFAEDPKRFERFSLRLGDVLLDYSKNRVSVETMALLFDLARASDVEGWRDRMFAGEPINTTEDRAVLHVALRNRLGRPITVDGADVMPGVQAALTRMRTLTDDVRAGRWTGSTGQAITDVINIGIGGSDLGPAMVTDALTPYREKGPSVHFVSNIDASHIAETLQTCEPATTLFIVASKTFTTEETLTNAMTAKAWITDALGAAALARHFVAVTANAEAAAGFGVDGANVFETWEWVGGRYSLWSAIGLPIALAVGMDRFEALLDGAHAMDEHFRTAPLEANMPVILALLGVWYANYFGAAGHAVLPYDQHLQRFAAYLQQLDMESNGKSVTRDGDAADWATAPLVFGEPGTNGQHAFYQLLHQGTRMVPADFIAAAHAAHPDLHLSTHHDILLASFFAQSEALMKGRTADQARREMEEAGHDAAQVERLLPHKVFAGNRPSNSILVRRMDPWTLGLLVALYEHKAFVQGVVWRVNSFDQWGVELGKDLAKAIRPSLADATPAQDHDSSTNGLINHYKTLREEP